MICHSVDKFSRLIDAGIFDESQKEELFDNRFLTAVFKKLLSMIKYCLDELHIAGFDLIEQRLCILNILSFILDCLLNLS
jgi:hypothetical protein